MPQELNTFWITWRAPLPPQETARWASEVYEWVKSKF
jgi:hypothetical protein